MTIPLHSCFFGLWAVEKLLLQYRFNVSWIYWEWNYGMEASLNRAKYHPSMKKILVISNKLSVYTLVLLVGSVHLT